MKSAVERGRTGESGCCRSAFHVIGQGYLLAFSVSFFLPVLASFLSSPLLTRSSPGGMQALKEEIRRLRGGRAGARIDLEPASTYEVVTRQMVEGMRDDLQEIRLRINGLIFLVAGSVLVEVVARLAGG